MDLIGNYIHQQQLKYLFVVQYVKPFNIFPWFRIILKPVFLVQLLHLLHHELHAIEWPITCQKWVNRQKLLSLIRKSPTLADDFQYRKTYAATRWIIRHTKRDNWRTYCSSLLYAITTPRLWQYIRTKIHSILPFHFGLDPQVFWVVEFHCILAPNTVFLDKSPLLSVSPLTRHSYINNDFTRITTGNTTYTRY